VRLSLSHIKGYLTWLDLTWLYPPPAKKFRRQAWHTHRTGLQQLAITKLQLFFSGLDNELERYIADISAPFDVECGLTFWQDRPRQVLYCKLSPLELDLVAGPASQAMLRCFFRFAGTFAQENAIGQVPSLSNVHFLEWTNSILAWMAIDSSLPAWETNTNCCQNLMLRCLVCILFALLWTVL